MRCRRRRGRDLGRNALVVAVSVVLLQGGLLAAQRTWAAVSTSSATANSSFGTIQLQPPTALGATSQPAGGVALSWAASSSAALRPDRTFTYQVFRRVHGSGGYAAVNAAPGTSSLAYSDTPPSDGSYDYVVETTATNFASADSGAAAGLSDRVAPAVSIKCNGGACSGAFLLSVSVVISATDTGSGLASITYTVNGGTPVTSATSPASFTLNSLASDTVVYWATDVAGNATSHVSVSFTVV